MNELMFAKSFLYTAVILFVGWGGLEAWKMSRFLRAMKKQREFQQELDALLSNPHRPGFHDEVEAFLKQHELKK